MSLETLLVDFQAKIDTVQACHDLEVEPHGGQAYMMEGIRLGLIYALVTLEAYVKTTGEPTKGLVPPPEPAILS